MLIAFSVGNVWAAEVAIYTLDGTQTGGDNGYATESTIEQSDVTWKVTGNTDISPWRIGGKGLSNVNRPIYSTSSFDDDITKVTVSTGTTGSSLTVNSIKLIVSTGQNGGGTITDQETKTSSLTSTTLTFSRPEGHDWSDQYFTIVFNVTRTGTSGNGYVQLSEIKLYAEESTGGDVIVKTLKSIAVTGQTTAYEVGDVFSFDGTCTATYSVTKNDVPQDDEEKTVTPTTVSSPDMTSAGSKEVTVSYTESAVTKEAKYNITVSAASGDKLTTTNISNPETYQAWPAEVSGANAKYIGYSTGGTEKIQMRTNDNASGIVSTSTGGLISKVKVTWQTSTGRTLDIYGYDKPYTAASELYGTGSKGTKIGSIVYGTSTQFTYTGDTKYPYVGVRSSSGALYLTDITFEWDPVSEISIKTAPSTVTYDEDDNFDPTDLVITATYESGKTLDVAYADVQDFTFSPALTDALTTSDVNVSITYGGQSVNQAITVNAKACTPTDLAYAETAVEKLDNDDNFTNPLTLTTGQTVAYTGDDDDVATVNPTTGEVDIVGAGTVHITASVEEEEISSSTYCAKSVSYTLTVTAAPVATGTFELFDGTLEEGDYVIYASSYAMKNTVTSSRFDHVSVTPEDDKISNPDASLVWHIAPAATEGYWTIYNEGVTKYAGGSTTNNQATLLDDTSTDYALWEITISGGEATVSNKGRGSDRNLLQLNSSNYKWGLFTSGQVNPTLYKKAAPAAPYAVILATCTNGSVGATAAAAITSGDEVLSGTTITLSNTPTSGYQLVAYDVYKTGEPTTKVTVKETAGVYTFKMPAYAVTISATFSEILILDHITLSGDYQETFWQGVPFNSNNLVVTASYTNAADAEVTPASITDPDMSTPGVKTITVSYTEGTITKEESYDITVKAVPSTLENPYTVAEARSLYDAYHAASIAQPTVYVKGVATTASMETSEYAPDYKDKAYNVYVKDAETEGTITFEFYRMLDGRGAGDPTAFTNGDITTGDTLIAVGKLSKYSSTYEFSAGCNLKVRKAYTAPKVDISNTKETAYTVAQARALIDDLSSDLASVVFVKGVVTSVSGSNIFIKDAGTDGSVTFEFYNCQDVTGVDENDTIIGTGTFKKHNSIYELNTGCEVVEIKNYVEPVIAVTGVSLNHDVLNLTAGQKATLIATIEPDNASNTDVAWESDKPGIATVVNGLVTAVSEGTAVITVTTDDGGKTASCTVNVAPHTVVPGTYGITFNNAFWGTSYTGTDAAAEDELQGSQDDITIHHTKSGSNLYVNDSETRAYANHTMEISVPTGYVITQMAFNKGSKWNISVVSDGSFTGGTWSGEANSVTITFGDRTDLTTVSITYAAVTPPTPTYTEVRNGLNAGEFYTMCLNKAVTDVRGGSIWRVLSKAENGTDVILEEVEGTLDAGRPYIFYATAAQLEVVYEGAAVGAPITTGNNGLVGSFTQEPIAQSPNNFIIYNNALYYVNSDNVKVGAHRAYLDMTGVPTYDNNEPQQGNAPRRRVTMAVYGEQVATGMESIQPSEISNQKVLINGQLFILRGEKMYDATGRLVK